MYYVDKVHYHQLEFSEVLTKGETGLVMNLMIHLQLHLIPDWLDIYSVCMYNIICTKQLLLVSSLICLLMIVAIYWLGLQ